MFVAKFTKSRDPRSVIIVYYKKINSSEHNPRPLETEVKCDQNILYYRTTVRVRGKYFETFPPFEETFEISYLSCCGTLFIKSVSHPLLRLKPWDIIKVLIK